MPYIVRLIEAIRLEEIDEKCRAEAVGKIVLRRMERDIIKDIQDGEYVRASKQLMGLIDYTWE